MVVSPARLGHEELAGCLVFEGARFFLRHAEREASSMADEEQNIKETEAVGELGDHYARVTLDDEENVGVEILEPPADNSSGTGVDLRWAAVGRFLADKSIRVEIMKQVLASVWRPVKGVRVKEIPNSRFVFQFFHEKDIQRILNEEPWAFENATLVLERLKDGDQPTNVFLDRVNFWIQVHNVP